MFLKIRDWMGLIITCAICIHFFPFHWLIGLSLGIMTHTALWIFVHANHQAVAMKRNGHKIGETYQ